MWQKLYCFGSWLSGLSNRDQGWVLFDAQTTSKTAIRQGGRRPTLGSIIKELAKLEKLNLLILDDWGLQPLDTPAKLSLLQLIEDRHGKNSTIITSQLPVAQWRPTLGSITLTNLPWLMPSWIDSCNKYIV